MQGLFKSIGNTAGMSNYFFYECKQKCKCGNIFALHIPYSQPEQNEIEFLISTLLIEGMIDYLCQSSTRSPSYDQPGDGGCVCTSLPLFTADPRARTLIDEAQPPLDLHPTPVLHNSRALEITSMFRFACAYTDGPKELFDILMKQIVESKIDINIFNFSSNFAEGEELG